MNELINGLVLPFECFVTHVDPKCITSSSLSFVSHKLSYSVKLMDKIPLEVPEKSRWQCFDEHYLLPIASELGLDPKKAAILIALRNAWVAYLQEGLISKISINEFWLLMTKEIATEYVLLTSNKWFEHPWMQEQINQRKTEERSDSTMHAYDQLSPIHYQAWIEKQEDDINFCINEFRFQKVAFTSFLEADAYEAEFDIKKSKKRIQELHADIEKEEAVIRAAMRPIRKFQNHERALKKRAVGRPKVSEMKDQQWRQELAKKFVARWVNSLMTTLSITSCGELAKVVGGQKMTWWRWLNKETLPPLRYLEPLLDEQIKSGEYKNTKLRDVCTTPALIDLITLVDLI